MVVVEDVRLFEVLQWDVLCVHESAEREQCLERPGDDRVDLVDGVRVFDCAHVWLQFEQ